MRGLGLKLNRVFLVSSALLAVGVVAWVVLGRGGAEADAAITAAPVEPVPAASTPAPEQTAREPIAVVAAASAPDPKAKPKPAAATAGGYARIAEGMTTHDTYAFVTALRKSKERGALAVVADIQDACRAGMGALMRYREQEHRDAIGARLAQTVGSAEKGEALQARYAQLIEARCRDTASDSSLEEPIAGDEEGAKVRLTLHNAHDPKSQFKVIYAMAEQGLLAAAHKTLWPWPFFEEKRYGFDEERTMLIAAIEVAAYRTSSDPSRRDSDLRLMALCIEDGMCDGKFESYWFARWPEGSEKRAQAMALADRVTRAFLRNDIRAFLPKLPPDVKLPDSFGRF